MPSWTPTTKERTKAYLDWVKNTYPAKADAWIIKQEREAVRAFFKKHPGASWGMI
jgi:hypothetical protein